MIVAGTGHRPNKLGGYTDPAFTNLVSFAKVSLIRSDPDKVISGMALGWDLALAVASMELGIPVIAALPFEGFHSRWSPGTQQYWEAVLLACNRIHLICDKTNTNSSRWEIVNCLDRRNRWMVDEADKMAALWNGTRGGTYNCVAYATKKRVPIDNHWPFWLKSRFYLPGEQDG